MTVDPKALILAADDHPPTLKLLQLHVERWGYRFVGAHDSLTLFAEMTHEQPALVLLDLFFGELDGVEVMTQLLERHPGLTVIMLTGHGSIETAVKAIKLGAYEYLTKPPDLQHLQVLLKRAVEKHAMTARIQRLEQMVVAGVTRPLWGESKAMQRVRDWIATVAPTDATVMILGESGTGKELVARSLHEQSLRRDKPFIPVNMAALPRELLESTLFGHERGSFTGADQAQKGCCEASHAGTLFLDEIGELEYGLQGKLLRFLQERTIQRVGSTKVLQVDTRVVVATNRDPQEEVRAGRLRDDLYYRLHVLPIQVPPLREHVEDVPLLANLFLQRAAARNHRAVTGFSNEALTALTAYDWPGNVRQLENLVERLVILTTHPTIELSDLPAEVQCKQPRYVEAMPWGKTCDNAATVAEKAAQEAGLKTIEQMERQAIIVALRQMGGNVAETARILGLGQATVYRKIKRYVITAKEYLSSD